MAEIVAGYEIVIAGRGSQMARRLDQIRGS